MAIGRSYKYAIEEKSKTCHIFSLDEKYLGKVWLDKTNAWNIFYVSGVSHLPINSALSLLGYNEEKWCLE